MAEPEIKLGHFSTKLVHPIRPAASQCKASHVPGTEVSQVSVAFTYGFYFTRPVPEPLVKEKTSLFLNLSSESKDGNSLHIYHNRQ